MRDVFVGKYRDIILTAKCLDAFLYLQRKKPMLLIEQNMTKALESQSAIPSGIYHNLHLKLCLMT
jgi:hypothetical protein